MKNNDIRFVAQCLAKSLDTKTLAAVIDGLLCVEEDVAISDDECRAGTTLFDILTDLCPNALEVAQGMVKDVPHEEMAAEAGR